MADVDLNDSSGADDEEDDGPNAYDLNDAMIDDSDLEEDSGDHLALQQEVNAAADLAEGRAHLVAAAHGDASAASGQSDRSADSDPRTSDGDFIVDDDSVGESRARKPRRRKLLLGDPSGSSSDEDQADPGLAAADAGLAAMGAGLTADSPLEFRGGRQRPSRGRLKQSKASKTSKK